MFVAVALTCMYIMDCTHLSYCSSRVSFLPVAQEVFLLEICNTTFASFNFFVVNLGLFGGRYNRWTKAPYSLKTSANRVMFKLESKGVFR